VVFSLLKVTRIFLKMNSVENLLKKQFSPYTLEEKIQIRKLDRPMPNLNLTQITK